jgi:hypothetical protein
MNLNRGFFSTLFMLLAFVFFVWLALVEGGVFKTTDTWQLGAGLASMVLSFLLGGGWASWNTRGNVP